MTKNLRAFKATLIMGLLLISVLVAMIPSSSAASLALIRGEQHVTLDYDKSSIEHEFTPTRTYYIPLNLTYYVNSMFPGVIEAFFSTRMKATIDLRVESQQDWFTCSISPNSVTAVITTTGAQTTPREPKIRVTLDERAPARTQGNVKVFMTCREVKALGAILPEIETAADVSFTPAYLPVISVNPTINFEVASPGSLVKIPINLENQGNAMTVVEVEILNVPSGWAVGIPSQVSLGSALLDGNPKNTVTLTVQAPYGFGYHDDTEAIQLRFTPVYYAQRTGDNVRGEPITETINVKSRGVSLVGIEIIAPILVIILVIILGVLFLVNKYRKRMTETK